MKATFCRSATKTSVIIFLTEPYSCFAASCDVLDVTVLIEGNREFYDYAEGCPLGAVLSVFATVPLVLLACRRVEVTYGFTLVYPGYVLIFRFNVRQGITSGRLCDELDHIEYGPYDHGHGNVLRGSASRSFKDSPKPEGKVGYDIDQYVLLEGAHLLYGSPRAAHVGVAGFHQGQVYYSHHRRRSEQADAGGGSCRVLRSFSGRV